VSSPESRPAPRKRKVPWVGFVLMGFIALSVGYRTTLAWYTCEGPSMEPTLAAGERFFILRSTWAGEPQPGDVIVARTPDGLEIVKRVLGVGGQTIAIANDQILVEGRAIGAQADCPAEYTPMDPDETACVRERIGDREWLTAHSTFAVPDTMDAVTVPAGQLFVMGDHRDRSNDSRNPRIGTLPIDSIVGVVIGL